jgi:hypothetical protein
MRTSNLSSDRYTAKLGGLYPEDPLQAARADEAVFLLTDLMDVSPGCDVRVTGGQQAWEVVMGQQADEPPHEL